ncbi:MAG: hypothetical protein QXW39_05055 [Candidatus Bathyarchaeia archaeon]
MAFSACITLLSAFYYGISQQNILFIALALSPILIFAVLMLFKRAKVPRRIDEQLVSLILHMYVISLGEAGADEIVRAVAETEDYGYYSKVFLRIRSLAKKFGYGFTKATAKVAAMTKPPLRDVLVRCQQFFSSMSPRSYLELENSMIMEEYSGYYERAVKTIEIFGGIYSALQSIVVFILMVVVLMVVFTNAPTIIYYVYGLTPLMLIVMLLAFKFTAPREKLVYIDREIKPKLYKIFRLSLAVVFICIAYILAQSIGGSGINVPLTLTLAGLGILMPGSIAYLFERSVYKIDENYPTLIKSLGENISSTSSLKSALYYILYLEIGPLKKLVKRVYSRLKVGISNERAMRLLSAETASYKVYLLNKMFLDSFSHGADPVEVSKVLGTSCVKFLDLRSKRFMVSRSLESVVYLLQPMSVALLVILAFLSKYFSQSLSSLPYFTFGRIPVEVVEVGNIFIVIFMALINALILKVCRGGFWGGIFLYLGILLILSAAAWVGAEIVMKSMFGGMMEGFQEIISV